MKPSLPQFPSNTFVARGAHDPLTHTAHDFFWFHVEPFFAPITREDIQDVQPVDVDAPHVPIVGQPLKKDITPTSDDSVQARIRSFPLAQRLTAALLDEGPGQSNASKNIRAGFTPEDTWIPSTPDELREFNQALEERIRTELIQAGLLDTKENDELATAIRHEHWHLRNLNVSNSTMTGLVLKQALPEIKGQAARRDKKISDDRAEIKYIESMMEKGGKRGKGRFTKLLNQMHPNRNLLPGDPLANSQKPGNGAVEEKAISKKRKKKQTPYDRAASKNQPGNKIVSGLDPADHLAPQIAEIIWKHNNQASIDEIVKEFIEKVPQLASDTKEARRRINSCISFSRKPFRFRRLPDGVTYSAKRI